MVKKGAVVAFKTLQTSLLEAEQTIDGSIQKVAVVRDHNHTAAKVFEQVFQNAQRLNIEIIGGFIQQQHVGSLNQHSTKTQPSSLSS